MNTLEKESDSQASLDQAVAELYTMIQTCVQCICCVQDTDTVKSTVLPLAEGCDDTVV